MEAELHPISYGPDSGSSSYLGRWNDPRLELPKGLTSDRIVEEEVKRIATALAVVLYAATLPRRLGGEASDEELAADKRRCRRVAHALTQAHKSWRKRVELPSGDEIRQAGAQLIWDDWIAKHLTELNNRSRLAATFAVRSGDEKIMRWGKTAITNFENERKWISYALR